MRKWFETGLLMSLGMLSLTREKAEAIAKELVDRGETRREDAHELVDRLMERGEEERKALSKLVRDETKSVLKELDLATRGDVASLSKKIDALAKKLSQEG